MAVSVIIMAAGAGTRMKSDTPKVLHKVCGREMLYYAIREAQKLSDDVSVVLYHQSERVREQMESSFKGLNFVIQDHANYPGTGGALMGVDCQHEKVLVLNGDMPLVEADELKMLVESDADIAMSVLELDNPSGYGRVVIEEGEVQKIVEEKDADEATKKIKSVNAGVYLFSKTILESYLPKISNDNKQKEYYLTDVVGLARNDDKHILPFVVKEENFKGVNSKLDLAHAEEIMGRRIKERWMKAGVIMRLPETIYIEDSVEFAGECMVENGVSVLGNSKIENSVIKTNSVVEDSHLMDSSVGPLARIRPKSELKATHIGNFVEVKKSSLTGVKAGHLSYLGDAIIDEGTNVGAGTITCNYDGMKKYQTVIGKNVFIGSDTQLVAPIKIEDNVLIAAGTTVTKDIESGSLAISRTPQVNKPGFFERFFKKD